MPANELRVMVTSALADSVWVMGIAAAEAAAPDGDDDAIAYFSETVDRSPDRLRDALEWSNQSVDATAFASAWRDVIDSATALGSAAAQRGGVDVADARAALAESAYTVATTGEALVSGAVPIDDLQEPLDRFVEEFTAMVRTLGDPARVGQRVSSTSLAADALGDFATVLVTAMNDTYPADVTGDATSPLAQVRADLTALISAHVFSIDIAADLARRNIAIDDAVIAYNATGFRELIASTIDDATGDQFARLWSRQRIELVEYAAAVDAGDTAAADQARNRLDRLASQLGDVVGAAAGFESPPGRDVDSPFTAMFSQLSHDIARALDVAATDDPDARVFQLVFTSQNSAATAQAIATALTKP